MIALGIESSSLRGMGHLFRSLLYVKYMQKHSIEYIYLINNDKKSIAILKRNAIKFIVVDYDDKQTRWEHKIIDKYNVNIWLNDKFETSEEMALHIKEKNIYLALIDDIGDGEIHADINFVGLISFSKNNFRSKNIESGMEYVVLSEDINLYKYIRKGLKKIIVSFGGSDPFNNTISVVKKLMNCNYLFDVTIGPNAKFEKELEALNDGRFRIYKNVPSLIELFSHYDLAITGGGVTCCEANAAGLPCIIVANAPHEINTGKNMQKFGGAIYAGSYKGWDSSILDELNNLDIENMSKKGMDVFKTNAIDNIFSYIKNANGLYL